MDRELDPNSVWYANLSQHTHRHTHTHTQHTQFTELGPLLFSDASLRTSSFNETGIPTPFRNEYSWTKFANVLIYDSPPPVGYSFCGDDVGGDGYSCGNWTDERTASAAHTFINNFFREFPQFSKHDLYLSGESYAGIYIPTLARAILQDTSSSVRNQLKGFAVGDGCVGKNVLCGGQRGPWFSILFFYGHGQFSTLLFNRIVSTCGMTQLQNGPITDSNCQDLLDQMNEEIGGYYSYNLYDTCGAENVLSTKKFDWREEPSRRSWGMIPSINPTEGYPCGGTGAMLKWLNHSDVKSALNVPPGASFFLTDNGVGFNYELTEKNLMPFYRDVAQNTSLRVLVYNGDTDPGINSFVSQNWTVALGLSVEEKWRPWTLDGKTRMGGYVTSYKGDFQFLTIRGSGHMVPEFKPVAAFEFMRDWIQGKSFKPYET